MCKHARLGINAPLSNYVPFETTRCSEIAFEAISGQKHSHSKYMANRALHEVRLHLSLFICITSGKHQIFLYVVGRTAGGVTDGALLHFERCFGAGMERR